MASSQTLNLFIVKSNVLTVTCYPTIEVYWKQESLANAKRQGQRATVPHGES